jgi:HrpA-like RNA helicase
MSATMQESIFSEYFSAPVVHVSGRTFPVEIQFLETIKRHLSSVSGSTGIGRDGHTRTANDLENVSGKSRPPAAEYPRFDAELVADVVQLIVKRDSRNNRPLGTYSVCVSVCPSVSRPTETY